MFSKKRASNCAMQKHAFLSNSLVASSLLVFFSGVLGARGFATVLLSKSTSDSTRPHDFFGKRDGGFFAVSRGRSAASPAGRTAASATCMAFGLGPESSGAGPAARTGMFTPNLNIVATTSMDILRGGGAAAAAAAGKHNVLSGVLSELANIRTPAALLGGAALGMLFIGQKEGSNRRLHMLYTALSTTAFTLQLICVLSSTLTCTAVASQGEAIATSAIAYLIEHKQFEFYVVRASFIYGLFSFIGALMARGWLAYSDRRDQGSARVMMAILATSCLFLLNFIHHTHNQLTLCLGGMTKRLFELGVHTMYPTRRRLLRHLAWVVAIWVAVKLFRLGPNQGANPGVNQELDTSLKDYSKQF